MLKFRISERSFQEVAVMVLTDVTLVLGEPRGGLVLLTVEMEYVNMEASGPFGFSCLHIAKRDCDRNLNWTFSLY